MSILPPVNTASTHTQTQSSGTNLLDQVHKLVEQTIQEELSTLAAREQGLALIAILRNEHKDSPQKTYWSGLSHLLLIPSADVQNEALRTLREIFPPPLMAVERPTVFLEMERTFSQALKTFAATYRSGSHPIVQQMLEVYEDILEQIWQYSASDEISSAISDIQTACRDWIDCIPEEMKPVIKRALERLSVHFALDLPPGDESLPWKRFQAMGALYEKRDDKRRALIIYQQLVSRYEETLDIPTLNRLRGKIGTLAFDLGDFTCAEVALKTTLESNQLSPYLRKKLQRLLLQVTYAREKQEETLKIAFQHLGEHPQYVAYAARIYLEQKEFYKASRFIKRNLRFALRNKMKFQEAYCRSILMTSYGFRVSQTSVRKKKRRYTSEAIRQGHIAIKVFESLSRDHEAIRTVLIARIMFPSRAEEFICKILASPTSSCSMEQKSLQALGFFVNAQSKIANSNPEQTREVLLQLLQFIESSTDPQVKAFGRESRLIRKIFQGSLSTSLPASLKQELETVQQTSLLSTYTQKLELESLFKTLKQSEHLNPKLLETITKIALTNTTSVRRDLSIIGEFNKLLKRAKKGRQLRDQSLIHYSLGQIYTQNESYLEAKNHLKQAIKINERFIQGNSLASNWKAESFEILAQPLTILERIYILQGKADNALELSERRKAPSLEKMLSHKGGLETTPPMSIHDMQALADRSRITFIMYTTATQTPQNTTSFGVWIIRPDEERVFRKLEAPIFFGGVDEQGIPALPKSAFEGGKDGDLDALFANLPSQHIVEEVAEEDIAFLENWHRELIAPIADLLPDDPDAQVTFVPEGPLSLVPFHILRRSDGRYLIEDHTISMAPSLNSLRLIVEKESPDMPLGPPLIFGEPDTDLAELKFAQDEIDAVLSLHQDAKPVTHTKATPACFEEMAPQASRIHVSMHGTSSARAHDYSVFHGALCCTPEGESNGHLYASRIKEMDLVADLVFLSACQTGQGQVLRDGIFGLVLAFLAGGARSVVGTLWNLKDSELTVEMIHAFYTHINKEQMSVAKALRQAMLLAIEKKPLRPLDWGALFATGDA